MNPDLKNQIGQVEKIAAFSKLKRLLHNPYKYILAIGFRQLIYPKNQQEKIVETILFFGKKMKIALPAATDIYLTGGKSHHSEINLAKFIMLNLNEGDCFLDIGAHFGYFTLLSSQIVGGQGRVFAFEPASKSFQLLKENTGQLNNTQIFQKAVAESNKNIAFYEFPNLFSEYNSYDIKQFENEEWFQSSKPKKVEVQATTIDKIMSDNLINPQIIKIDVEGAEYQTILGGLNFFRNNSPKIVMEYLEPARNNDSHRKALELLKPLGYLPNIILQDGSIRAVNDIDNYLITQKLDSENIVFIKKQPAVRSE